MSKKVKVNPGDRVEFWFAGGKETGSVIGIANIKDLKGNKRVMIQGDDNHKYPLYDLEKAKLRIIKKQ